MDFTTDELQKLYDLLVFEAEGREEHELDLDPAMDSAFEKIVNELTARGVA